MSERSKYEHWSPALIDFVAVILLAIILLVLGPTIAEFFYQLPDPAEADLTITIHGSLTELIFSKRMIGIILCFIIIYICLKVFLKTRQWRRNNWELVTQFSRAVRWMAAGFLTVDILILGRSEVISKPPIILGFIELSLTLYRATGSFILSNIAFVAVIAVIAFSLCALLNRALQFLLVGIQAGQFLVIEYAAGLMFEQKETAIVAGLGALAAIFHLDTMRDDAEMPWDLKLFLWLSSFIIMIAVAVAAFYILAWPYLSVAKVIFAP